jgi:hypothetical protein
MIYLASPYSHDNPQIMQERYEDIARLTAHLLFVRNIAVISPIVYGHQLAVTYGLPTSATSWRKLNTALLRRCDALWVVQLPDWDSSRGVKEEIELAKLLQMPIHYVDGYGEFVL